MRNLFALISCPYCNVAALAVMDANCSLPLRQRINITEVLPQEINHKAIGDPRLSFLATLNKSESVQEWGFPILVLDSEGLKMNHGNVDIGITGRAMVHSSYSHNHYKTFIKHYMSFE
jgi:hypothetical protein